MSLCLLLEGLIDLDLVEFGFVRMGCGDSDEVIRGGSFHGGRPTLVFGRIQSLPVGSAMDE